MAAAPGTLFTVGHSNHEWLDFLRLLKSQQVTLVADVRSVPVSRLPYFHRESLAESLRDAGIEYRFLGRELGARRDEPECYEGDLARYEKIQQLPMFQQGIEELVRNALRRTICLMCAEKEPLDCHRTILISRELQRHGIAARHILADGAVEEHAVTERRLMKLVGVEQSLFDSQEVLLAEAYERRGREIAYRRGHEGAAP